MKNRRYYGSLQKIYRHSPVEAPLCFIDVRVLMYKIANTIKNDLDNVELEKIIKLNWAVILNNPLPYLKYPPMGYRVILGDDFKNENFEYWRNDYLPEYKKNRLPREQRPKEHELIVNCLSEYAEKYHIPIIKEKGFECDDIAGSLYRIKKEKKDNRALFLNTVDSDWMQLVDDDLNIMFANTMVYGTNRLRSEVEVLRWAMDKNKWGLSSPKLIIDNKYYEGDVADNIPKLNPAGKGIIDLIAPLKKPGYNVEQALEKELKTNEANTNEDHYKSAQRWLLSENLPIVEV